MRRPSAPHVSWTGRPLAPRTATVAQAEAIARADAVLASRPDDVESIAVAARAREDVWRYGEAVDLYGRAMALDQGDYRWPLCRAHRLIRLRRLDHALADLDVAKTLDPTGFNTCYLRGLTLYLLGRFDDAASEYLGCLQRTPASGTMEPATGDPRQCALAWRDPASRVALTSWTVRALARAGRRPAADRLLDDLPATFDAASLAGAPERYPGSPIVPDDNVHYWTLLRYYRGEMAADAILATARGGEQFPTIAYGVAAWTLARGEGEEARRLLVEIVADGHWARLGHVAAEADLVRMDSQNGEAGAP